VVNSAPPISDTEQGPTADRPEFAGGEANGGETGIYMITSSSSVDQN
jgi:hypothetical protein